MDPRNLLRGARRHAASGRSVIAGDDDRGVLGAARRRTSRSSAARSSASSAATAPARRRCSRSCPASPSRPRAGSRSERPRRQPARGRHRLPSRADGPREHLPERRDPRHDPRRRCGALRRDRRLLRRREVHRHAGQALLGRHVCAPGLRRRGPSRARDPGRRRGARGRRCGIPEAQMPRPHVGGRKCGPHGAVRQPQSRGRHGAHPAGIVLEAAASSIFDGPIESAITRYAASLSKDKRRPEMGTGTQFGDDLRRSARRAGTGPTDTLRAGNAVRRARRRRDGRHARDFGWSCSCATSEPSGRLLFVGHLQPGILLPSEPGRHDCTLTLQPYDLASGDYCFDLKTTYTTIVDDHRVDNALRFVVDSLQSGRYRLRFQAEARATESLAMKLGAPLRIAALQTPDPA